MTSRVLYSGESNKIVEAMTSLYVRTAPRCSLRFIELSFQ